MNGWEHIGGLQQHQVPTFYSGDCAVQASHLLSTSKYTHHRRWKYIEHRIPYWTLLKQHYYHHPVCGKTYKQLLNVSLSQHVWLSPTIYILVQGDAAVWSCGREVDVCITLCQSRLHAPSILSKLIATVHLETKLWNRPCNGIGLTYQVLIMSDRHSMLSKQRCDGPQSYFITRKYQWDING